MEDRWLDILAKVQGLDRQELANQANKDRAQRDKDYSDSQLNDQRARDAAHQAQMDALKRQHDANMATIGQESNDSSAKLKQANRDDIEAAKREVAQKEAELDQLIAAAKAKAAAAGGGPNKPNAPEKPDLSALNAAKEKMEARGVLNSFNLASLNVSPLSAQLEKFSERTADATERAVELLEEMEPGLPVT